jgi:hypothetical protein
MRNVNGYYYRITIENPVTTQDVNGALVYTYEEVIEVWAKKRIFRTGQGGTKQRQGNTEINVERIQFNILPLEVPVEWNQIIKYQNDRYEIASIQDFKDEIVISCYTTPISNTRSNGSGN